MLYRLVAKLLNRCLGCLLLVGFSTLYLVACKASVDKTPQPREAVSRVYLKVGESKGQSALTTKTPPYELLATVNPLKIKLNEEAKFILTIIPHAPWELKDTTPFQVQLKALDQDLQLTKTTFTAADFLKEPADKHAPEAVGSATKKSIESIFIIESGAVKEQQFAPKQLRADITFFLCSVKVCERHNEQVDIYIEI